MIHLLLILIEVNSSSSVTLVGDYNIGTSKYSWYYEKPKEDATYWKNGKLYWVIEVSGSGIKKGTKITDCISSDSNLEDHFLHSDPHGNDGSIVGVYLNNDNRLQTIRVLKNIVIHIHQRI